MSKTWKDHEERVHLQRIDRNAHRRDKRRVNAFRSGDIEGIMRADDYEEPENITPTLPETNPDPCYGCLAEDDQRTLRK